MRTTSDNDVRGARDWRSTKLKPIMLRWHQALVDVRNSLLLGDRRQTVHAPRRIQRPADELAQIRPAPVAAEPPAREDSTAEDRLVALPDDRALALALLCDRLLDELDGAAVTAAEIRFVVHKAADPSYPRLEPASEHAAGEGELVWELRRLIAWSGGTIADVARALEARGAELDERARRLLQDELAALDVDLATVSRHLADPVDWDGEFGSLLAGEVSPFDDPVDEEDDQHNA